MSAAENPKPVTPGRLTVTDVARMHAEGARIPMLTAYDYPTARLLDEAGIPLLLVGDSLGEVILGYESTVRVTMDEMLHHTKAVVRGTSRAMVIGDMPFLSYSEPDEALENAGRFMREAGAGAVKIEGGTRSARIVEALVKAGHPDDGPHRLDAPGQVRDGREDARPGQGPRRRPGPARRRPGHPGGGRVRGRPRARPGAARGGDHRATADPDDRDRRGRRLQRPGPGHHRPPGPGLVHPPARPPVRAPARRRSSRRPPPTPPTSRRGPSRDRSRPSGWTTRSSARSSVAPRSTGRPSGADVPAGGIPLDRDL